ncbi:MAG: MarR family transcriptional regulator [Betaproteobacteria bacterium]|nr:MarR family transcriptional regulator [Betaproteobacteria bacterium]
MRIHHSLESAVPFLLARAGISMGNQFTKQLLPYGVSLIEWRVCVTLYTKQDSTLGQLTDICSNDTSTLSRTVSGLIKKGFVNRVQSSLDKRSFELSLTRKGKGLAEKIIPLAQRYEEKALLNFNRSEADQLRAYLNRVYLNINILPDIL